MLIGFEGTAGSLDSLKDATVAVWRERAAHIWAALNEPIPFGRHMQTDMARNAGHAAESVARNTPPVFPGGLIMRAASGLIGEATRMGVGSVQAVGSQMGKAGDAFRHGSIGDREYADATVQADIRLLARHGFINQLVKAYGKRGQSVYVRGPTTAGWQDESIVREGVTAVAQTRKAGDELIVAGYSRGGLNAINACNALAKQGHEIQLLILFDPVDRDTSLGRCNVSAAVHNCILVQRTGETFIWKPYVRQVDLGITKVNIPDVWLTNSRWNFGRMVDGSHRQELTRGELYTKEIDATHAAFGGVPWTGDNPAYMNQQADRTAATAVADFVNRQVTALCRWQPGLALTQPQIFH